MEEKTSPVCNDCGCVLEKEKLIAKFVEKARNLPKTGEDSTDPKLGTKAWQTITVESHTTDSIIELLRVAEKIRDLLGPVE